MSEPTAQPKVHWIRRLCQVVSLAVLGEFAFYGVFRCPFAVPYVSCGDCPVVQCPGRKLWIPVWIAILASGIVIGRGFCGWACPAGLVADLLGKAARLKSWLKGTAERLVPAGKYAVLADIAGKLWRPVKDNATGGGNHADYLENLCNCSLTRTNDEMIAVV